LDLENQRVEILKNSYERLKKQNAAFSVRALARKMNLTPAFISKVFNNKTPLPFERVDEFAHHLKMDKTAKNALIRTYDNEKNRKLRGADNSNEKLDPIINTYKILPERSETLLSN
jgi:transcriptional regulator with XRE-family HTH domain